MAGIQEVCHWNASEAQAEKTPKSYENFQYESAAIDSFNNISKKVSDIKADVQAITSNYKTLKGKFDEFTGFNDEMDKNSQSLEHFAENIEKFSKQSLNAAIALIQDKVKEDQSFQTDLDKLNSILSNGSLSEGLDSGANWSH